MEGEGAGSVEGVAFSKHRRVPNRILGELSIPGEAFGSVRISFSARTALSRLAAGGGVSEVQRRRRWPRARERRQRERERERERESRSCRGMQKGRGPGRVRRVLQIIQLAPRIKVCIFIAL